VKVALHLAEALQARELGQLVHVEGELADRLELLEPLEHLQRSVETRHPVLTLEHAKSGQR
jgi:hypothetical protein